MLPEYLYVIYYVYVKHEYRGSVSENPHIGQPVRGPTTIVQICHNQHKANSSSILKKCVA